MKKLMPLLMATAFAFVMLGIASHANAATFGKYSKGVLVPVTVHDHAQKDTVVGILCPKKEIIWWVYFDNYSHHVEDGQIKCTANDLVLWSLNQNVSSNKDGYMIFTANDDPFLSKNGRANNNNDPMNDNDFVDGFSMAANAFMVDIAADDAVFIPVLNLICADPDKLCDYNMDPAGFLDLTAMNQRSIKALYNGFKEDHGWVDFRFWFDPDFEACTHVQLWTTSCINEFWRLAPGGALPGKCFFDNLDPASQNPDILWCPVKVFDADEHYHSISIPFKCEVHAFVPANDSFGGAWPGFNEGFLRIPKAYMFPMINTDQLYNEIYTGDMTFGAFGFSYVTAKYHLRAAQTLMPAEYICNTKACNQLYADMTAADELGIDLGLGGGQR